MRYKIMKKSLKRFSFFFIFLFFSLYFFNGYNLDVIVLKGVKENKLSFSSSSDDCSSESKSGMKLVESNGV